MSDGFFATTPETEAAAAAKANVQIPRRLPDLVGLASLAVICTAITAAWIGTLIWFAFAAIKWLVS
jgi:hypothetical protein